MHVNVVFNIIFYTSTVRTLAYLAYRMCIPLREEASSMEGSLVYYSRGYDRKIEDLEKV